MLSIDPEASTISSIQKDLSLSGATAPKEEARARKIVRESYMIFKTGEIKATQACTLRHQPSDHPRRIGPLQNWLRLETDHHCQKRRRRQQRQQRCAKEQQQWHQHRWWMNRQQEERLQPAIALEDIPAWE